MSVQKVPCRSGCGGMFHPAGRGYHEKFCTGAGYLPMRGPRSKGQLKIAPTDKRLEKVLCRKGCGRYYCAAGLHHHEKFCDGPGFEGRALKRAAKRNEEEVRYTGEEEMAYELFCDDAAMYTAVLHLLEARDGKDVLENLRAAKSMIDIKIRFLEK